MERNDDVYRVCVFVEKHLSDISKGLFACYAVNQLLSDGVKDLNYEIVFFDGGDTSDLMALRESFQTYGVPCGYSTNIKFGNALMALAILVEEKLYESVDKNNYGITLMSLEKEKLFTLGHEKFIKYADEKWLKYIGGDKNKFIFETIKEKKILL